MHCDQVPPSISYNCIKDLDIVYDYVPCYNTTLSNLCTGHSIHGSQSLQSVVTASLGTKVALHLSKFYSTPVHIYFTEDYRIQLV